MVILGIDPGSTRVGYGLIKKEGREVVFLSSGILTITAEEKHERLLQLEKSFRLLLKKTRPDLAVMEKLFFVKNVKTGMGVAESRGILTLLIIQHRIPLLELTPLEIKQSLTGYGKSDKAMMMRAVQKRLGISKIQGGDDAADGIAAALAGLTYPLRLKLTSL
ncbi:MAG: crossover junction endodeoxyribonuclease RuvC [Patescibacteria group bacterium]